jgi:hypothetical protein
MATYSVLGPVSAGSPALRALQGRMVALQALVSRLEASIRACAALTDGHTPESPMVRRTVKSGLPEIATGTALPAAPVGTFRVRVLRLARQHHIASDAIPAARSVIPAGRYVFALGVGERTATLDLAVGEEERDADVLETLGHAVAAAGLGARSWVEYGRDERGDVARLHVQSWMSGTRAALYTADVSRNLMVLIGLAASGDATDHNGGTVETPDDALYEIDGEPHSAPANRVYLPDRRICLALHSEDPETDAVLATRPDAGVLGRAAGELAMRLADARAAAADPAVKSVIQPDEDFVAALDSMAAALREFGLAVEGFPPQATTWAAVDLHALAHLAGRVGASARVAIAGAERAGAALQRQAEWYQMVPDPSAARRLASQAIASYFPGSASLTRLPGA